MADPLLRLRGKVYSHFPFSPPLLLRSRWSTLLLRLRVKVYFHLPFLPAAPPSIHGPRSNMGTCKESPRSKKRKTPLEYQLQVEEDEIHRDKYNPGIVRNESPRSKKFKSSKNKCR